MAAPTDTYVDPSINANTGAGTVGDPYGDLQHALDTITRDSSNGDHIHIKAGTDEVMSAALSLASYGTPNSSGPLILEGYTTTKGDGGIGSISGGGLVSVIDSGSLDFCFMKNLKLHNTGSNKICEINERCYVENVEFTNTSGSGLTIDRFTNVHRCTFHNIGGNAIARVDHGTSIMYCYFYNDGANDINNCIQHNNEGSSIGFNVFNLDNASSGIFSNHNSPAIFNNTFYGGGGTGQAMDLDTARNCGLVMNNIIVGFSGEGADGIIIRSSRNFASIINNFFYDNTEDIDANGDVVWQLNNTFLTSDPFVDSSSGNFNLVDSDELKGAALGPIGFTTFLDPGALQRSEPDCMQILIAQ